MKNVTTFIADTFGQFTQLEKELLEQGFSLFLIEGKRMKYDKWESGSKQIRADIFMKFWRE